MVRNISASLGTALVLAGLSGSAMAQSDLPLRDPPANTCSAVVQQEIDRVGIPQTRIDRINISRQSRDIRGNTRTTGFNGWVRLNDCPGSLVVDMDRSCRVRQVYVRGMCDVPNVKTFD